MLIGPGFGPRAVDRYGEIGIETDCGAGVSNALRDGVELQCRLPLKVLVVLHTLAMVGAEALDCSGSGIAKGFRPQLPTMNRWMVAVEMFLQRFEQGVALQRIPASSAESVELGRALIAYGKMRVTKLPISERQSARLKLRDRRIVDKLDGACLGERCLELLRCEQRTSFRRLSKIVDLLDVEIEGIEKQAARRAVGATLRRVQRVHADDGGTARGGELDQRAQIAEVADAPVPLRAHAVELHHEAPHASALRQQLRLVAAPGLEPELRRLARAPERLLERLARRGVDRLLAPPDVEVALGNL